MKDYPPEDYHQKLMEKVARLRALCDGKEGEVLVPVADVQALLEHIDPPPWWLDYPIVDCATCKKGGHFAIFCSQGVSADLPQDGSLRRCTSWKPQEEPVR